MQIRLAEKSIEVFPWCWAQIAGLYKNFLTERGASLQTENRTRINLLLPAANRYSCKIKKYAVRNDKIKPGAVTVDKLSPDLADAMQNTRNPRVLDGGDNLIGYLINLSDDKAFIDVLTVEGYVISNLRVGDGQPAFAGSLFFASGDCSGIAYTAVPNGYVTALSDITGVTDLYFAEKDSVAQAGFQFGSLTGGAGCSGTGGQLPFAWPASSNVPATTGVSSLSYPTPINIEFTQ